MENIIAVRLIDNYNDIIISNLSFLGTVIAIFFALITLPIQNILGQYSQDLVNNLKDDKYFRLSLRFFIAVFLYNLLLLVMNVHLWRISTSVIFSFLSFFIFILLIRRTYHLLDIRNQIKEISQKIIEVIPSKIKEMETIDKNIKGIKSFPSLPGFDSKFRVPISFTDWLTLKTDPIIDVINTSIKKDRYEIVQAVFNNILAINKEYIRVRKDYTSTEDEYLKYIINKLRESKILVSEKTHPKIMEVIVNTAGNIAQETLKINTFKKEVLVNTLPQGFLIFIREIILSSYILHETSFAANDACEQYIQVAFQAIDKECFASATVYVSDLGSLSIQLMNTALLYSNFLSRKVNGGLVRILHFILNNLKKINNYYARKLLIAQCFEEINDIIAEYSKTERKNIYNDPIAPFLEISLDFNLPMVLGSFFNTKETETENFEEIIDALDVFLMNLNRNIERASEKIKIKIINIIAIIGFIFILNAERLKDEPKRKILSILDSVLLCSPIFSLTRENTMKRLLSGGDEMDCYSLFLGMMILENENNIFNDIIKNGIENLISKTNKNAGIYQYLKKVGSWIYKFDKDSYLLKKIKKTLSKRDKEKELFAHAFASREIWFYPQLTASTIDSSYLYKVEKELFNPEDMKKFEDFLAK